MSDIWKDPAVKAALKEGRSADDIVVLPCPRCNRYGYYNEGSHFWCRKCRKSWYVLSEGESPLVNHRCTYADEVCTLADTVTVTTDGYENETNPKP